MKKGLLLALLAVFFLAGYSQADTLRLLTWKGYAPQVLVDKFEKETGIKVEVTYSNNEEMIAKLRATRGAGFDLAQPSQDRISSVQAKYKIYQAMDYSKIDSSLFISSMLGAVKKNTKVGGDSFAAPFCWGTSGLIVNSAKAPGVNSWKALLDDKYKGRVSYRLKRPTLIAMGYALGYDPFALYSDAHAYKAMLDKIAETLIAAKPLVKNYWPKTLMLHTSGLTLCSNRKMLATLLPHQNTPQPHKGPMPLSLRKFVATLSVLSRRLPLTISSGTHQFQHNLRVWKVKYLIRSRQLSS